MRYDFIYDFRNFLYFYILLLRIYYYREKDMDDRERESWERFGRMYSKLIVVFFIGVEFKVRCGVVFLFLFYVILSFVNF